MIADSSSHETSHPGINERSPNADPLKVSDFLRDPRNWCQGADARDRLGVMCPIFGRDAVAWNALAAVNFCYPNRDQRQQIKFDLAYYLRRHEYIPAETPLGSYESACRAIWRWNDHPSTTHHEILEAVAGLGI